MPAEYKYSSALLYHTGIDNWDSLLIIVIN